MLAIVGVVKAGRTVVVCDVRFSQRGDDTPFAYGHASFMASPNPDHVHPERLDVVSRWPAPPVARAAARACRRRILEPGCAELPRHPEGLNATGGIQGGLVGLAVEEAATSCEAHSVVTALALRYLRPFRIGPRVRRWPRPTTAWPLCASPTKAPAASSAPLRPFVSPAAG